ncbi:U-box domain-containing protein 21-like [Curcuma longa]|uniref:U-box domain-containing protein 21-like n=1 Tax=Curcuma longa TaxID=136217 RepID=UPI003D9F7C76
MAFPWRSRSRRIPKPKEGKRLILSAAGSSATDEVSVVPAHFRCPISLELMEDPVTVPTGITYDRRSIEEWLERGRATCPVTNRPLGPDADLLLIPNHSLRRMIQDWTAAHGPDRVPTPKAPLSRAEAADLVSEISAAAGSRDWLRCEGLASAAKRLARESERNRRCLASAGAALAVAAAFRAFVEEINVGDQPLMTLEQDMVSLLATLPRSLREAAAAEDLGAPTSLRRLAAFVSHGREPASAAVLVRDLLVGSNGTRAGAVAAADGMVEALVELIKKPVSSQATKASLVAVFYIIKDGDESSASRLIELGLVGAAVETLAEADRGGCEKALGVLEELMGFRPGREAARGHALAVPALVKKMFKVSEAATEMAVSAMWKLCGGEKDAEGRCAEELLQAGAFQKLLLLLQIGCSEEAKEKVTHLLRMLSKRRGRQEECIDTKDFQGLNRIQ